MADTNDDIYTEFKESVNMTASELEDWLSSEESKSVGWSKSDGKNTGSSSETEGHKSGETIVAILHTHKADLTDDDYAHMKRVNAYIARHSKQGPQHKEDIKDSRWRYSLMNWGHDPLKS